MGSTADSGDTIDDDTGAIGDNGYIGETENKEQGGSN